MKDKDFFYKIAILIFACSLCLGMGFILGAATIREQAIKVKAAHYTVDEISGKVSFTWKINK